MNSVAPYKGRTGAEIFGIYAPYIPLMNTDSISSLSQPDMRIFSKKPMKFTRAKWYYARFDGSMVEKYVWCKDQFGPVPKNPDAWTRWYCFANNGLAFRDEADYLLFLLKWV